LAPDTAAAATLERVGVPAVLDPRGALSFVQLGAPLPEPIGDVAFVHLPANGALDVRAVFVVALSGTVQVASGGCVAQADEHVRAVHVRSDSRVEVTSLHAATALVLRGLRSEAGAARVSHDLERPRSLAASTVHDCRQIALPAERAPGALTVSAATPFPVRRVYWIHDLKEGARRGAHAHRALWQSFHAARGAFDLHLDDGRERATYHMDDPGAAVIVPPMLWRDLDGFSEGAVCVVLASEPYDPDDYVRDYAAFRALKEAA
jgi:hypothetical protein